MFQLPKEEEIRQFLIDNMHVIEDDK